MELILQTGLNHQQKAVDSIADVFQNTGISQPNQYYSNPSTSPDSVLFGNIQEVQKANELHSSLRVLSKEVTPLHLDIKMETGTGKTYVYTHAHGDTLTEPKHWDDEPFDCIISNPPYSIKWEGDANPLLINDPRFSPAGVLAPKSQADLAFTLHMLSWLSTSGTAAIVEFPGVLYRSGAEQKIRKYLIDNNYVDAVIQLPPDLFFGTTIATCVVVLKKSKKDNATLFIDASAEFVRGGNKNKLTEANRKKILNAFVERKDIAHFARLVPNSDIAANDYNISISSYAEQENTTEEVNIEKLNAHIAEIVIRQNKLRTAIDEIVADLEGGLK